MPKNNVLLFGNLPSRLEPVFSNTAAEQIDVQDGLWSMIKMVARDHFNQGGLSSASEMLGIVLRVDGVQPPNTGHLFHAYYAGFDEYPKFLHLKIRVPEIHVGYPIPESEEDSDAIDRYPTFLSMEQSPKNIPVPGTLVNVKFLDSVNYASPVYVGNVELDQSMESITDATPESVSARSLFSCAANELGLKDK